MPQLLEKVSHTLFHPLEDGHPVNTYAILDSARDKTIYKKIMNADAQSICLYHGEKAVELATVAPYLVHLAPQGTFTEWLLTQGWGNSWGIFFQAPESLTINQLQRHFRKFLMVFDEDGKPLYFRFYDPRVFRIYLPTCNESELEIIFGPVTRYLAESKDCEEMIDFSCHNKKMRTHTHTVQAS